MSEGNQPEIVLNEFGELSRRARRELAAQGIDPDTAVMEHIRTQSIPIIVDANALVPRAPINEAPVFTPALSRRDMRNLRERSDITSDMTSEVASEVTADDGVLNASDVVEDVVFDVAPYVIDHREDASEITKDYEPFSFRTTSTQSTGVIPTTGSALILPTLPEHAPGTLSSFSHTGEIPLTGSFSLAGSIGHYGADMLSLDTSEIDIIAEDEDFSSSQDLAPVRASTAVSAYSTSNTVVTVPSKFRDRLPLVLAITAAGLAVAVVALFITGYVTGVF